MSDGDRPLFEALRAWRAAEAKAQHVPPYVIFHDRTLAEIAAVKPGSRARLAALNGVGEAKLAHYGEAVLQVVGGFGAADHERPPTLVERAQELREHMSPPERLLWEQLRGKRLEGWKFRRQHPLEPYVLDFYCPQAKLVVEVDGQGRGMGDQPARDERRDAFLERQGLRVVRIRAETVFRDMDAAVRTILGALES
jgi:very-short-patch-repair endonuclease